MRLDGRRKSSNVDDRRGIGAKTAGGGIVALIVGGIIYMLSGGSLTEYVFSNAGQLVRQGQQGIQYEATEQDEELAEFSAQILAGTEDVWSELFRQEGLTYRPPTMVLYSGSINTGCGQGTSSMGPFYCSADEKLYIDLDFFKNMRRDLGADGDFAYAYVIGHEVGHHVQHLLGTLDESHERMSRMSKTDANRESVRIELQADYLAGVWAHHDNRMFGSLEPGDIEEALDAAMKIGDDYLQKQAQGYAVPEAFTHGTSQQRWRWLKRGLDTGTLAGGDTFSQPYSNL
ncbi:MAG: zinc metallopeptidase [Firmicutes bacterium]|nr:zinc metallopeptidase [Bacillota bacterium]MCM1401904.1 zinc metallopeptidase [Bacteroides sp.]MCM1477782.1 zinc metallopeptidase [Bacteroides sp.]